MTRTIIFIIEKIVLIFKFILIYLLHVLLVFKIKGIKVFLERKVQHKSALKM